MNYCLALVLITGLVLSSGCVAHNSTIIKKQSTNFIDVEADLSNAWFGCFEINPEDHLSLMNFYVKDGVTTHEFFYRTLISTRDCAAHYKDYLRLIKGVSKVRIVGIAPLYEDKVQRIDEVPEKFATGHKRLIHWTFIRMQTERGCEAYFSDHCSPEEYWGGIIPPND